MTAKITLIGVIGADGFGAAAGIMKFIASGIWATGPNPVTFGGLVTAVGVGAATSSIGYLALNYH